MHHYTAPRGAPVSQLEVKFSLTFINTHNALLGYLLDIWKIPNEEGDDERIKVSSHGEPRTGRKSCPGH